MQPAPFLLETIQNRTPVKGDRGSLGSLVVEPFQNDDEKDLWSRVVKAHHYLGFGRLFGHQIKYLARLGGQVVAALSVFPTGPKTPVPGRLDALERFGAVPLSSPDREQQPLPDPPDGRQVRRSPKILARFEQTVIIPTHGFTILLLE